MFPRLEVLLCGNNQSRNNSTIRSYDKIIRTSTNLINKLKILNLEKIKYLVFSLFFKKNERVPILKLAVKKNYEGTIFRWLDL